MFNTLVKFLTSESKQNFYFLFKKVKRNKGMTYIELIVVLGIFAVMSSIVMFNYGSFERNINIKNVTSDIAIRIVQAQKFSVSGKLPSSTQQALISVNPGGINAWRPSYGIYFNIANVVDRKSFIYFTDINQDSTYGAPSEAVEQVNINKGNYISSIQATNFSGSICTPDPNYLTIVFKRPDSGANFKMNPEVVGCVVKYADIVISTPSSDSSSKIRVHASGRIEII